MKRAFAILAVCAALVAGSSVSAQEFSSGRMTWTGPNSYIYDATSFYRRPLYGPTFYGGYGGYGGLGYGGYGRYRALPPYGFGSPYYNGYNDPYARSYGPGVQEFLRFGGADFYGW